MTISDYRIESTFLGERRTVTLFLPLNYESWNALPLIFCADGQVVRTFSQRIHREISDRNLPAIVLVGVHSSEQRSQEYTVNHDDSRFRQHERFFTEELPDWLLAKFGLAADRSKTGIFGFSHGGAFALTMAARHRDVFGVVIAFSIAGEFEQLQLSGQNDEPKQRYFLSAGTREKPLLKTTRRLANVLKRHNIDHVVTQRHAGHDYGYWESELPIAIKWAFGDHNAGSNDITK